jgi:hypothetical protein
MKSIFKKRPVEIKFVKPYQFYLEDMTDSLIKTICQNKPIKVFNATTRKEELYYPEISQMEKRNSDKLLNKGATETL